jgi:hypothetical protein
MRAKGECQGPGHRVPTVWRVGARCARTLIAARRLGFHGVRVDTKGDPPVVQGSSFFVSAAIKD